MRLPAITALLLFLPGLAVAAEPVRYEGFCDASAAVMIDADRFVVANDDDNVLRIYSLAKPGKPVDAVDVNAFLKQEKKKGADIEGAARVGQRIYWIASHGTNKDGEARPDRRRFFATDIVDGAGGATVKEAGRPVTSLDRLFVGPFGKRFGLAEAAKHAPESSDGLNIEGLAAGPDGGLLIGFRNPIPGRKALVVPLVNGAALVEDRKGKPKPGFGLPLLLDLGGLGIRSIENVPGTGDYLIVGGAAADGPFRLFRWKRGGVPVPLDVALPAGFHPEALMFGPNPSRVILLSDDGDGCGAEPAFRLLSVELPRG
jgi:hypothetical protein